MYASEATSYCSPLNHGRPVLPLLAILVILRPQPGMGESIGNVTFVHYDTRNIEKPRNSEFFPYVYEMFYYPSLRVTCHHRGESTVSKGPKSARFLVKGVQGGLRKIKGGGGPYSILIRVMIAKGSTLFDGSCFECLRSHGLQ